MKEIMNKMVFLHDLLDWNKLFLLAEFWNYKTFIYQK